ncbi:hypothetical protein HU200_012245 [Digitaria exilis]|uniref:Uncharacterized protein n=1 Tax=Digitaria exilis TaxID=1010633 RepID=A0A835FFZ0_9POAL|nr:hypothetical protein HU200_012245 [Digitaria exilis]
MLTFLRIRHHLLQHFRHRLDLFHHQVPGYLLKQILPYPRTTAPEPFDPFSDIPLKQFDGSDPFGGFSSNAGSSTVPPPPTHSSTGNISTSGQNLQAASDFGAFVSNNEEAAKDPFDLSSTVSVGKTPLAAPKTDASDFWCLSKKVNLADIGIVGGLGDGSDEKSHASWTMGTTSGLGMGIPPSTQTGGIESLANYNKASIWLQMSLEL